MCSSFGARTNWANNYTFAAQRVLEPETIQQLCDVVMRSHSVKALGSRHSFNDIADTSGVQVSTSRLTGIERVDPQTQTVTVEGGVTYGRLCLQLERQGYALHNMASLPHITVAGACATATHGSGERHGNLATAVSGIEIVQADGTIVSYSRAENPDLFCGVVVGLGALGIVSQLTLDVVPSFNVAQAVYLDLALEDALARFDEIQSLGYSVSLFSTWRDERIDQVWIKQRMPDAAGVAPELFGAKAAGKKLHPIAAMDPEPCTEQLGEPGRWYERLPHFRLEFTPSAAVELQAEYFVPRRHAAAALRAISSLREQIAPLLQVCEIRTIAADDLWMSTCYQRDSVSIHFTWFQKQPEVEALLPVIERKLAPYNARPHWGKLFCMDAAAMERLYPRLPDFRKLVSRFDPTGKFRNGYLDRCLWDG